MTDITHVCSACAAGYPEECENPERLWMDEDEGVEWIVPCIESFKDIPVASAKLVGRPPSDPRDVKDATSTGRKRAKMISPILDGQRCGWAGLKHAGGGVVPMLGCTGQVMTETKGGNKDAGLVQGDRHHGPDKNTLNNSPGLNLHSICVDCHHRWHALNDSYYGEGGRQTAADAFLPVEPYFAHDGSTIFTDEEYAVAEAWWDQSPYDRGPYPFRPKGVTTILPLSTLSGTLNPSENPFADPDDNENGD